jgi:aminoglycoside phosphotransferase (APT) family kinase protein
LAQSAGVVERLTAWFASRLPDAADLRVDGLDAVRFGHSAEMLALRLVSTDAGGDHVDDLIVRVRPEPPGLLEPYDMERQFRVLRALESTPVRAPRARWYEPSGDVLGREFYVMERVAGTVYERKVVDGLDAHPARVRHMCEELVDQLAAIHLVDLAATGLGSLADGSDFLDGELARWSGEAVRWRRGPLPQLERLHRELVERRPDPCPRLTLVHGDPKPGNFAFVDGEVTAVFDWELVDVGDPLADVAWLEVNWTMATPLSHLPGALTADELVERWSAATDVEPGDRAWYRAFQLYKMSVIMLVGAMLVDAGHSDDLRLAHMGAFVPAFTEPALRELGVTETIEPGPTSVRPERMEEL